MELTHGPLVLLIDTWPHLTWWRHPTETFSALLALCARNSSVTGEFTSQRPVMRSFDVFFDLRLKNRLSTQSCVWWFETPSRSFWRHCYEPTSALMQLNTWPCVSSKFCRCHCHGELCWYMTKISQDCGTENQPHLLFSIDMIIHPWLNFNGGSTKPPLK